MKWKLAVASLVATFALCTQTQGMDLLDRMLGGSGCGCASSCCETQSSCCDTGPSCGCDIGPSCGCDPCGDICGDPCCNKPLIEINLPKIRPLFKFNRNSCCASACDATCGCDLTPSCGCDMTPSCGCDPCGSSCDPCGSSCKPKLRLGLLDKIFGKRGCGCNSGCEVSCGVDACGGCNSGCGCASMGGYSAPSGGEDAAPVPEADSASLPPTPIVDPSAFIAPRGIYNASNR